MVLCLLLFFGGQFRLVNYFDSEIVRSLSAYFGKTRSEIGYKQLLKETTKDWWLTSLIAHPLYVRSQNNIILL